MFLTRIVLCLAISLAVATAAAARPFPGVIALPTGFQPEGIATGAGNTFFVGSIPTGAIYRGNLRTGSGSLLVPAQADRNSLGLSLDQRHHRLFVAGGTTGEGYVYDSRTGAPLASFQLATGPDPTFVNDVVVTRGAAWFTDSFRAVLYKLRIAPNGGLGPVTAVPLTGDFVLGGGFNANGIDATPNGKTLIVVQSGTGKLFRVGGSGVAREIALTGGNVMAGDGILLDGKRLYVVQNQLNRVAVVALSPRLTSGRIVGHLTNSALDVPTTIAEQGNRLYAVNARFGVPSPGTASYSVVQLRKRK